MEDKMVLAKGLEVSLDTRKTRLNNNVLVVGATGTGKTRGIVSPNLLEATGSYVVSDPKGNLYRKYKDYLWEKGYVVQNLDFTNPKHSVHYNFFKYINNDMDIMKISHMLIGKDVGKTLDPYWDETAQLLLTALISYLKINAEKDHQNLENVLQLLQFGMVNGDLSDTKTKLDDLFITFDKREREKNNGHECTAVKAYKSIRVAPNNTLRCIYSTLTAKIGRFDNDELNEMMKNDNIDIPSIGKRKTAIFVTVSDTDRSLDELANIFFMQAMNELCLYADKHCKDQRLPVPVRFILDDFATNVKIDEFPRMIASFRSRDISTMLLIQSEAQLTAGYGADDKTIIGNCDTYIYLGGNDLETAKSISERSDRPMQEILYMPIGKCYIFRRGQKPIYTETIELDEFKQKFLEKKQIQREQK